MNLKNVENKQYTPVTCVVDVTSTSQRHCNTSLTHETTLHSVRPSVAFDLLAIGLGEYESQIWIKWMARHRRTDIMYTTKA